MYLAFGASRFEACTPIAREALRLALTPTINQMRFVLSTPLEALMALTLLELASLVSFQYPV